MSPAREFLQCEISCANRIAREFTPLDAKASYIQIREIKVSW
jgi:hypothetical protein